ncbi:two pore domain potassium channel family protein [Verrucomicrobiaceae bacterium N1E253]|uniref:Two pore domain potassium channel family protein n=1 Tax=Oceaniferula marina TaxID=2748318 RepID=A0A851GN99_9BACT|nr:potassium channel family protein [Oceaniferula marina]NWK55604.1 two pore domain potassium channel family protein [Oceaniferula marina]
MEVTFYFIHLFGVALIVLSPVLLFLLMIIILLGLFVGRIEKWRTSDAIYFAFITATTVGYGDLKPDQSISKMAAIVIALVGIVLTGIIVAVGLYSVDAALNSTR